jgi:Ca2+-binding EF-hand superfamily protein
VTPPDRPPPGARRSLALIEALDADADGVLSKEEIEGATAALQKLDADKDGSLSRAEYFGAFAGGPPPGFGGPPGPAPEQFIRSMLATADKDGDEKLSKEEAVGPFKENFAAVDANKDGFLDREEMMAAARRYSGRPSPERTQQFIAAMLENSDKDKDGKLSKEEAPDRLKSFFDTVDANKDGFADKEELTSVAGRLSAPRPIRPDLTLPPPDTTPPPFEKPKAVKENPEEEKPAEEKPAEEKP